MLLFYDTETTGILKRGAAASHPDQPDIVQIAALLDDGGKIVETLNFTIHPYGFSIPIEASNIHGITDIIAREIGVDINHAYSEFVSLASKSVMHVGHNISFDMTILDICSHKLKKKQFSKLKKWEQFCTMLTASSHCKIPARRGFGYKWPTLQEAYQLLVDPGGFSGAHDALADVEACREVYYAIKKLEA